MSAQKKLERDICLKVYDAAVAEYRFNVQLAWDRSKFFLTLVSALLATGIGLLKFGFESRVVALFLILLFCMIASVGYYALESLAVGKKYVREANYKKALIEGELGLLFPIENGLPRTNLSIAVTKSQKNSTTLLIGESVSERISAFSLTDKLRLILWGMIVVAIAGALASALIFGTDLSEVPHASR